MSENNGKRSLGCGGGFLIAVVIVVILGLIGNNIGASEKPNEYEAKQICEDAVERNLKSPATATYDSRVQIKSDNENDYRILTEVDSQNGFGAMVRTNFSCNLTWSPEAKKWTLDKIKRN